MRTTKGDGSCKKGEEEERWTKWDVQEFLRRVTVKEVFLKEGGLLQSTDKTQGIIGRKLLGKGQRGYTDT